MKGSINCGASVCSIATNDAGTLIATALTGKTVKLFDPRMPKNKEGVMQLTGHTGRVRSVLMSQDSRSVSIYMQLS